MHLTNETLERLLAGTADAAEARALAAHLDDACPRCEALLAGHGGATLDALADHPLSALAPARPEERGNDLEYARIQRSLRAPPARRRGWVPAVAAAAVLAAGAVGLQLATRDGHEDRWDGVKGSTAARSAAVPVRLSAVAVAEEQRVWRIASGDELPASAAVQLRVELGAPADLAIARLGPGGDVDLFWHERAGAAGAVTVTASGRPAAYPLNALSGRQRFVVVASAGRLAPEAIRRVVGQVTGDGRAIGAGPGGEELSLDVISVMVR
jgi:hypothetical protein